MRGWCALWLRHSVSLTAAPSCTCPEGTQVCRRHGAAPRRPCPASAARNRGGSAAGPPPTQLPGESGGILWFHHSSSPPPDWAAAVRLKRAKYLRRNGSGKGESGRGSRGGGGAEPRLPSPPSSQPSLAGRLPGDGGAQQGGQGEAAESRRAGAASGPAEGDGERPDSGSGAALVSLIGRGPMPLRGGRQRPPGATRGRVPEPGANRELR